MNLEENAVELLLRSQHLDVGTILELLELGDSEFRAMAARNEKIRELLEQRRLGVLPVVEVEPRQCPICAEWFLPYASERFCSDPCKTAANIQKD